MFGAKMKIRVVAENINLKEYFEKYYSDPNWRGVWDDADKRLAKALEIVNNEYKKHLDVGCADGMFTKYYLEKYPKTEGWGIDISEVVIELAKKNCPEGHFLAADCYLLPFENEEFDMVHCAETIEHLEYPEKAIDEMWRVLKPEGILIITTPNEVAAHYVEHLWKWDLDGVRQMLGTKMDKDKLSRFKILEEHPSFWNGHTMYIKAQKT